MRNGKAEVAADFGLVEDGIVGTGGFGGVILAAAGGDVALVAGKVADGAGEIVPGADSFVGEMINPRLPSVGDSLDNHSGEIRCVGRSADLVGDHLEAVPLGRGGRIPFPAAVPRRTGCPGWRAECASLRRRGGRPTGFVSAAGTRILPPMRKGNGSRRIG